MISCQILLNEFSLSIEMYMWILSLTYLYVILHLLIGVYWTNLTSLGRNYGGHDLNGFMNSFFKHIIKIFASMFTRKLICSVYFPVVSLSSFGTKIWWLHRMSLLVFLLPLLFGRVWFFFFLSRRCSLKVW